MKKALRSFLLFTLISLPVHLLAQGFPWLVDVEGGSTFSPPEPLSVAYDSSGFVYVTGFFENQATIGSTTLTGSSVEGFLAKLDTAGSLIWVETFGGLGQDAGIDVVTDNQGGVYVSGIYQGTATFDTITVTSTISSSSFRGENFLIKFNDTGSALWIRRGSNCGSSFNPQNIPSALDYNNGTILYGAQYQNFFNSTTADRTFNGTTFPTNTGGTSSSTNFFVSSFQPNGTQNFVQPVLGEATFSASAILQDVVLAPSGDVFALALGFDSIVIGSSVITNPSLQFNQRYNALIKLNSSGTYQSSNLVGDLGFSTFQINNMDVSSTGTVYVGAFRNSSITSTLAGVTLPAQGAFAYKVNGSSMTTTDATVVSNGSGFSGSSNIGSIVLDSQGNVFLGGAVDGGVTIAGTVVNAQRELYFAKCDTGFTSATYVTRTIKPGSGNFQIPVFSHAALGSNDEIYVTGNVVASSTVFGSQTSTSNSNTSGFITRIVDCLPLSVSASPLNAVICGNAASVNINATNNPSYNYQWLATGSPVAGANTPTFAATNPGSYSVEVDSLGCLDTSNTVTVSQEALPTVSVPTTTLTVCNIAAPFTLQGGQPAGGVWSGTGVVNDTVFDPSIVGSGPVLLTYTYTSPSGCSNDAVRIANVVAPTTLTVSNNIPSFCEGDPAFSLTSIVNPSGGTYSGPGVTNNLFNPDSAGVGTHSITYTYAVITGCTSTVSFNIVVNAAPTISFPAFSPVCNSTFSIPLNSATPAGGTYTGNFTISNTFYPFLSGAGNFPVIYTVTQNGCTASDTQSIQVDAPVTPTLSAIGPFCAGDAPITLTQGSPAGGTYLIDGTPSGTFDPVTLGVGSYTVQYAFTNACGTDTATQTVTVNPIPSVTLSAFGPYCENDASVTLTQGSPAGGVYSGSGVVGGDFVPSQAQIGTNQIIYTFTGAGGCSASDTTNVVVFAKPVISMNLVDTLCIDNGLYTLAASPAGGSFTGTGVTGTDFDPQVAGVGSHVITYTVTNTNNCSDTLTDTIEVIAPVTITLNPFTPVCEADAAFMLSGGSPAGGSYSGIGVVAGMFNPAVSGAGTFDIVYTFTTACGLRADTQQITVNPAPIVTLPVLVDVCVDGSPINLPAGSPAGGTYAGTGVIGNQFYPGTAGVGTFDVVYSFTAINGCSASDTQQITVNPLPTVTFAPLADVCIDAGPLTLSGGMPMGGSYSGPGVAAGQFDASIAGLGTHTLVYTYSDANGCADTAQQSITVNDLPVVTWQALPNVCANDVAITLSGGLPSGGTYSGPGVAAGQFNPQAVGAGTYTLAYTFSDANGCADSATESITVEPLPAISLNPFTPVCVDNGSITLTGGSPAGGTYSGTGVAGGQFDPQAVGPGTYDIIYTVTGTTCSASDTQQIVVNPLPIVDLAAFADACIDAGTITLSGGTPVGGTYSGTGVTSGVFDPQVAGIGTTLITYTFTDVNGCINSDTASINVGSGPTVTLSALADLCVNDAPITLTGGMPMGGVYSGTGVAAGIFDPQIAGVGTHTITYVYTAPTGCADSATATITVNPLPVVTLASLADVCIGAGVLTLTGGLPAGGVYSGTAVTGGQFAPSVAGVGTHDIIYSFTNAQGCISADTQQIIVNDLPVVSLSIPTNVCVDAGIITFTSGSPAGGTYAGTGVTGNQFNPAVAGLGQYVITYTYTDLNSCTNSITDTIEVDSLPAVTLPALSAVCENDAPITLSGGMPMGGTYSGTGVSGGQFDPNVSGAGTFLITYTFTDGNGCASDDTVSITVNPAPTVSLSGLGDVCLDGGLVTLTGGLPAGGTYSGSGVTAGQFDPLVAGIGQHVITYSFTSSLGCTATATDTIEVSTPPSVSLPPLTPVCIDAGVVVLAGGTPSGGTYSGIGVTGGQFDPAVAGVGTHSIVYTFVNAQGCGASDTQSIVVNDLPAVSLPLSSVVCDYAAPVTLTGGTPAGGTYSGLGVTGTQFDPSVTGQGTFDIIYQFTDANGCIGIDTGNITVSPRPSVSLGPDLNVCIGEEVALTATGADSYVWSTTETTNSILITPTMNSTYTVTGTDTNSCEGFDTIDVTVNPLPVVNLPSIDTVCADSVFTLDAGAGFTQYRWNTGALVQAITVGPFTPNTTQTYWVLVEDALRCTGGDSVSFFVKDCDITSVGEIAEKGEIKLYPNPNQGRFVLEASHLEGQAYIHVISVTGSMVYQRQLETVGVEWREEIDLTAYGNGMYTLVVTSGEKVYRKQFMINR